MQRETPFPLRGFLTVTCTVAGLTFGCAKVDTSGATEPEDGSGAGKAGSGGSVAIPTTDARVDSPSLDSPLDVAPPPVTCVGLQCQRVNCATRAPTSISGRVFAPNGTLPLYNVIVYIPNAPLEPLPTGLTCDRCGAPASGHPIVSALSDSRGVFKLTDVPAGPNIPLVLQVGKWRRQVTLPMVTACQDNPITDANLTRLPRNRQEGDMPRIAVTTGPCDQVGCLLPKLGIDTAELGAAGDGKAITYYIGNSFAPTAGVTPAYGPTNMTLATDLWNDETRLGLYDLTLLSCECMENLGTKSAMSFTVMNNYLNKGGRIFGSHYSYVWLKYSPDTDLTSALTITHSFFFGRSPMTLNTSFPKGKALADWMKFLNPTITYGQIESNQIFDDVESVTPPVVLAWASSSPGFPSTEAPTVANTRPRLLTVNTPAGMPADKQCGRAALLDFHVTLDDNIAPPRDKTFPGSCGTELTQGEEALAFLFFDLASCIQDDTKPPVIP